MNSQELETAVRLGIDIVVLILRDDAYGMIKWKQADMAFGNFGLDYGNPDQASLRWDVWRSKAALEVSW